MSDSRSSPWSHPAWQAVAVASALFLASLLLAGHGPVNGDAAVYQHQAAHGILEQRSIHVGYVALARLLCLAAGDALPWLLDALNALSSAILCAVAGSLAARQGGSAAVGALATAACLLPVAPFAEVDALWAALLAGAVVLPLWVAPLAVAASLAVSPLALLALPWLLLARLQRACCWRHAAIAPIVGLLLWLPLLAWCGMDWFTGPRGVLTDAVLGVSFERLGDAWLGALALPGLVAPLVLGLGRTGRRGIGLLLLAILPLFLLVRFADVHAWMIAAVTLGWLAGTGTVAWPVHRALLWVPLVLQLAFGWRDALTQRNLVRDSNKTIANLATQVEPGDLVVASWSWGVRYGIAHAGEPYEGGWVQATDLDPLHSQAVWVLPPGRTLPGPWRWEPGPDGVMRGWRTSR